LWSDGALSLTEAGRIFDLNRKADPNDREWSDFFVDSLTAMLVDRGDPRGYVTPADADWLIEMIDADGKVDSMNELGLLEHLFERAFCVPDRLKAFALSAVEQAVRSGSGPTRDGGALEPGTVNAAESRLLRRFVFAPAGDGPAHVSRDEAEMLWRLKDASLGRANAPEWKTLFVQALGNHLLAAPRAGAPSRDDELAHQRFLDDHSSSVWSFMAQMVTSAPDFDGARDAIEEDGRDEFDGRLEEVDDGLDRGESGWLDRQVRSDRSVDEFEQALLDFLHDQPA
jgi:hypothetical protein